MDFTLLSISQNGGALKVAFPEVLSDEHFLVDARSLAAMVVEVRRSLDELCHDYLKMEPGARSVDQGNLSLIHRIAEEGQSLRRFFFSGASEKIRRFLLEELAAEAALMFKVSSDVNVHVPWGLMFGTFGEESIDIRALNMEALREGFWGKKYKACAVHTTSDMVRCNRPVVFSPRRTDITSVFHKQALEAADCDGVVKWPGSCCCYTRRELIRTLEKREAHSLLYFFCHAEQDKLLLEQDELDPYQLTAYLQADAGPAALKKLRGLFFLNGCQTGVSEQSRSWLKVTYDAGFLGFVGTEAVVPTRYAYEFGKDFLRLVLVDGYTPVAAIDTLRDRHWPLGLLYGLYCFPEIVAKSEAPYLPKATILNYCHNDFGGGSTLATLPFGGTPK